MTKMDIRSIGHGSLPTGEFLVMKTQLVWPRVFFYQRQAATQDRKPKFKIPASDLFLHLHHSLKVKSYLSKK